jgi:hypothetical protein
MARRLGDNLTTEKRLMLGQLTMMPGWVVLKEMIEEECKLANTDIIKLDPETEKYAEILTRLHLESRALNEFAASLIKSAELQVRRGEYENEVQDRVATLLHKKEAQSDLNKPVAQSN